MIRAIGILDAQLFGDPRRGRAEQREKLRPTLLALNLDRDEHRERCDQRSQRVEDLPCRGAGLGLPVRCPFVVLIVEKLRHLTAQPVVA